MSEGEKKERILDSSSLATRLAAAFALFVALLAKWLAAQRAVDVRSFVRLFTGSILLTAVDEGNCCCC